MTDKRMGPKPDAQAGEKLFRALRELEIQFLNGGHSVQTSIQKLLKDHKFTPANEMGKYLVAQSILKRDPDNGSHKKPYYFYNGPRLSVQYCNELILQMKIERAADKKTIKVHDSNYEETVDRSVKSPMGANLKTPDTKLIVDIGKVEKSLIIEKAKNDLKQEMLDEAIEIRDKARDHIEELSQSLEEARRVAEEYEIVVRYLLPKKPF